MKTTSHDISQRGQFAALLKAAMTTRDLSAKQVAEQIGTTQSCVYLWTKAKGLPTPQNAAKLERILGISLQQVSSSNLPAIIPATAKMAPKTKPETILEFDLLSNGEARLKLDIIMPASEALPLFRLITDHTKFQPKGHK